ncbi:methylated-DNA--[protein]-cysteine S-methyltransferase [Shewanella electrica]|uniref:methylated-DNA--[protein]-cysteine S-methyltransferase n=1 Tax=Shewanella electrica TaxID=515560 RepID=UPI0023AFBE11|nr:methylated-DNA--[protein]-cysteine S-methyltransferase [Shewanella electrica]
MSHSYLISGNNPSAIASVAMASPVGQLWLTASELGLCSLRPLAPTESMLDKQGRVTLADESIHAANAILSRAQQQLEEYFAQTRQQFTVPLAPTGTVFQQFVWQQLLEVPFGATASYGELAQRIGNPKAARAVGAANGANRIAIIIPCHRVIGKQGALTGYAWGLTMKQQLIDIEQH